VALTLHGIASRRAPDELAPPGWRNVRFADQRVTYKLGDADVIVAYRPVGHERRSGEDQDGRGEREALAFELMIGGKVTRVSRFAADGDRLWFVEHGGHRRSARVARAGARGWVLSEGQLFAFVEQPQFVEPGRDAVAGGLTAPMPGKVVKVLVAEGQEVAANAALVVLEAMKMEHTVRASAAGTVRAIHVAVGDQVDTDRVLAIVTA
jgi:biotin carboxyl carrier protein